MKNFFLTLNILHVLNDGLKISLVLLLPFIARDLHFNLTQVGILGSSINFIAIVFALPAAYFALKIGGLRTLLIAMVFYCLGFFLTSQAMSIGFVVAAFVVAGIGFGLFHPIGFALVSKISKEEKRGKEMGNFSVNGDIGAIAISAITTFVVVRIGWHLTALLVSCITGIIFLCIVFVSRRQHKEATNSKQSSPNLLVLRSNKKFLLVMITAFLDAFVSVPIYLFLPFLLLSKGVAPAYIGIGSGIFFAGSLLGKGYLGRLVDRFGNTKVFIAAEFGMALLLIGIAFAPWTLVVFMFCFFLGSATRGTSPATKTMIYEAIEDPQKAEKGFGISEFFICMATTIGPTLFGFLSDRIHIVNTFAIFSSIAIAATISAIIFDIYVKRDSQILEAEEEIKTTI